MFRILFAFLVLVAAMSANAETHVAVERPAVKVGDSWTYTAYDGWNRKVLGTSVLKVTSVGDVVEILSQSKAGTIIAITETPDTNTISRVPRKGNAVQYSTHSGRIVFPLDVGKKWVVKSNFTIGETRRGSEELDATVVGWEKVTVPAGTFTALKITWTGYYRSSDGAQSGSGKVDVVLWYSPEVKRSVKSSYKEDNWNGQLSVWVETELAAYKVD